MGSPENSGAISDSTIGRVIIAVLSFCAWLDRYGETSYDHQSFFASKLGRTAKSLYYRQPIVGAVLVSPMVACEAFIPSTRRLFWKPQRFPIADAHYAMGFASLADIYKVDRFYTKAVHFLSVLQQTRCRDCSGYAWGYPFSWQTRNGVLSEGTPLITTVPYVYEAFSQVRAIDGDNKWLEIMYAIAEHAFGCYAEVETGPDAASCAYTPTKDDRCGVVNASAYRAFLLTKAGIELGQPRYLEAAKRNLTFVLNSQNTNGSWCYSVDGERDFIDHFHTCFVLKALSKIEQLTRSTRCSGAIERGIGYYLENLFDHEGLPIPFSKAPRLTVYRRELYDYAECINLCVLLRGRFPELDRKLSTVLVDLLERWQKPDGAFRARELMFGWDNVPMHRWAQSQAFRSLCFLLSQHRTGFQVQSLSQSTLEPTTA